MSFAQTDRGRDLEERLLAFMDERVYPAEPVYAEQMEASGDPAWTTTLPPLRPLDGAATAELLGRFERTEFPLPAKSA